jgi:NAD(P)H dehydrogenase (quinone)
MRNTLLALTGLALATLAGCGGSGAPDADQERIIVSGASGQLGGLVVEHLLELGVAPERLILVSRTPETLAGYAAMGASTRYGDFTEPESLAAAYEGGDRMLLISIGTVDDQRPLLHRNAIDAAVAAGVRHIAYTSFVDAEDNPSPIADHHRQTEAFLRESGVAWTMLRNQLYMNGIVGQARQMLANGQVTVQPGATGTAYVTREDCARAAAAVLATSGHENRIYEITGSEVIGPREIAHIASEVTGREIEVIEAQEGGAGAGGPTSATLTSNAVEQLTGRPPTTAREFLEANRGELLE